MPPGSYQLDQYIVKQMWNYSRIQKKSLQFVLGFIQSHRVLFPDESFKGHTHFQSVWDYILFFYDTAKLCILDCEKIAVIKTVITTILIRSVKTVANPKQWFFFFNVNRSVAKNNKKKLIRIVREAIKTIWF